jgi:hypothetical protein
LGPFHQQELAPMQQQQQQPPPSGMVGWPALPVPQPPWRAPPSYSPPTGVVAEGVSAMSVDAPGGAVQQQQQQQQEQQQQQQHQPGSTATTVGTPAAMDLDTVTVAEVATQVQQQPTPMEADLPSTGPIEQVTTAAMQQQVPQSITVQGPTAAGVAVAASPACQPAVVVALPGTTSSAAVAQQQQRQQQQQQQQQQQPPKPVRPAPRLPAVAYAVLAVLPALSRVFYTPTQLQQQAGSTPGLEEDTFPLWPMLWAPGAYIWGHHLRSLVGLARGVAEDWDPGEVNAAGETPLPLVDAQALGPAFFAAFPGLVYAGPPEDRLSSVPREVVMWVRAWLQQRGYAVYLGYE